MSDKLENTIKEYFGTSHGDDINLLLLCHYIFSTYNDVEKAKEDYDNNACFSNNINCPNLVLYDANDENPKVQLFYLIHSLDEIEETAEKNRSFITKLKNKYTGEALLPRFQTLLNEIYEDEAFNFEAIFLLNNYSPDNIIKDADKRLWNSKLKTDDCDYSIYDKKRIEMKLDNPEEDEVNKLKLKFNFSFENPNNAEAGKDNTFVLNTKEHKVIVCALRATSLVSCYQKFNDRVFEQNIRYSISGDSNSNIVNADIKQTVSEEPDKFLIFNNGITIVAEDLGEINTEDNTIEVTNFSIVNGAQTVSNLVEINKNANNNLDKVLVIAKIIMPIKDKYDDIVERITRSSNNQKPVKARDFKANSKEMKMLQETFKKHGVILNIKRGDKLVAIKKYIKSNFNVNTIKSIKNDELGQIIISNILAEPGTAKQVKNKIFEKKNYEWVFLNKNITDEMIYDCYKFFDITNKRINKLIPHFDIDEDTSLLVPAVTLWVNSFLWLVYNNLDKIDELISTKKVSDLLDNNGICYNKKLIDEFADLSGRPFEDILIKCFKKIQAIYLSELNPKHQRFTHAAFSYKGKFFEKFVIEMLHSDYNNDERKREVADQIRNIFISK